MSPVVSTPTPSMFAVAGAVLLLTLTPLVAAAVLAFRGRKWWALAVGTAVMPMLLVGFYGAMSRGRPARASPAAESLGHWDGHRFESVADSHAELDPWHDAARRHDERLRSQVRVRREPFRSASPGPERLVSPNGLVSPDERVSAGDLPAWVTDAAPADRLVVAGPLVTDEDGGPPAARTAAEAVVAGRLAELAGLPPQAVRRENAAGAVRRAAVETLARTTGEHAFDVHRGHLLVDVSPQSLDRLRREYRDRVGTRRAAWAAGGGGVLVLLFAGLWGVGRRKLRHDSGARGKA